VILLFILIWIIRKNDDDVLFLCFLVFFLVFSRCFCEGILIIQQSVVGESTPNDVLSILLLLSIKK